MTEEGIVTNPVEKKVRKPRGKSAFVVQVHDKALIENNGVEEQWVREICGGSSIKACRAKIEELGIVGDVQIVCVREQLSVTSVQRVLIKRV